MAKILIGRFRNGQAEALEKELKAFTGGGAARPFLRRIATVFLGNPELLRFLLQTLGLPDILINEIISRISSKDE